MELQVKLIIIHMPLDDLIWSLKKYMILLHMLLIVHTHVFLGNYRRLIFISAWNYFSTYNNLVNELNE